LRILTEPRNSLISQFVVIFESYPSRLYFTKKALWALAERASRAKTGARALRSELERVLAEPIFASPTPYVLITEGCVRGTEKPWYWGKDGALDLEQRLREEDDPSPAQPAASFGQLREAGQSGG